ncbi:MAG: hypothetical protein SFU99_03955 [Saprospiraceae bacterium]|nr:hypothetical protein [Saprospiraceae bacterium]
MIYNAIVRKGAAFYDKNNPWPENHDKGLFKGLDGKIWNVINHDNFIIFEQKVEKIFY